MIGKPLPDKVPTVAIIVAMTRDRVIGAGGKLPWALPDDLKNFRRLTEGNTVIMGQKTFVSIGGALPARQNIVLSRTVKELPGVQVCNSFMAGLQAVDKAGQTAFVIGGEEVYRKALPIASELHISWVRKSYPGDTFFPEFDLSRWQLCETIDYTDFRYCRYQRKQTICG